MAVKSGRSGKRNPTDEVVNFEALNLANFALREKTEGMEGGDTIGVVARRKARSRGM